MKPVAIPEVKTHWLQTIAPALVLATVGLLCALLAWWLAPLGSSLILPLLVLAPTALAIGLLLPSNRRLDGTRAALARCAEHEQAREDALNAARRDRDLLVSALNALPVGIAVYDRRDRPILQNRFLLELIPDLQPDNGHAAGHSELLQLERQYGVVSESSHAPAPGTGAALPGDGPASILLQYPADRWIQALAQRNDQGVTVVARCDVTDLVRARQQANVANEQLSRQSATDGLTGITNRRRFDEILTTEWLRAARSGACLSLLMVDIDHFKRYNDHYGHVAGDECLRQVAGLLHSSVRRAGEIVARYGGEEFVILLPGAEVSQAEELAQLCLDGVGRLAIPHASSPTARHVTFSIGIAHVFPSAAHDPASLVNAADTAMYRAKMAGRKRYEVADLADWEIDKDAPRSRAGELN